MEIIDKVMLIHVPRTYKELMYKYHVSKEDVPQLYPDKLYDITRAAWKLDIKRARCYEVVFCVYDKMVREIYEVSYWERAGESKHGDRIRFVGRVSENKELREKYLHADVSEYLGRSPARYVN